MVQTVRVKSRSHESTNTNISFAKIIMNPEVYFIKYNIKVFPISTVCRIVKINGNKRKRWMIQTPLYELFLILLHMNLPQIQS